MRMLTPRSGRAVRLHERDELLDALGADVAGGTLAYSDLAGLGLLVAHHEHVAHLLLLRLGDLDAHRLVVRVHLDAQSLGLELRPDLSGVLEVAVGDRHDHYLHGCEPRGERAGVCLLYTSDA